MKFLVRSIMNNQAIIFTKVMILLTATIQGQYLSNLNGNKNDAIFSTYAAPLSRSAYKLIKLIIWYGTDHKIQSFSKVRKVEV